MSSPIALKLHSGESILLDVDKESRAVALYHNERWDDHRLFALIEECPALKGDANALAQIVYHLALRNNYMPIDDVREFQSQFKVRLEAEEQQDPSAQGFVRISDLGLFDVAGMHDPAVIDQYLEFFVETPTHVPTRVKVPFRGSFVKCQPMLAKLPPAVEDSEEPLTLE